MNRFIIRRILTAIPTLLFISFVISGILYLAPGDPTAGLPLSIPAEVLEKIRVSLGLDDPFLVRYVKWLRPILYYRTADCFGKQYRHRHWRFRKPCADRLVDGAWRSRHAVGSGTHPADALGGGYRLPTVGAAGDSARRLLGGQTEFDL